MKHFRVTIFIESEKDSDNVQNVKDDIGDMLSHVDEWGFEVMSEKITDDDYKTLNDPVKEFDRLKQEISELQKESYERLKNSTVCVTCSVPLDVHGTCCGWVNAQIKINDAGIIIDTRHPGSFLNINTWRNGIYDMHNQKYA